jgi:hypothetical protein
VAEITVTFDPDRFVDMVDGIEGRVEGIGGVLEDIGSEMLASVRFTHQNISGDLSASLSLEAPGPFQRRIVSDVYYSRFVFRGTVNSPTPYPPILTVPGAFADRIAAEVIG